MRNSLTSIIIIALLILTCSPLFGQIGENEFGSGTIPETVVDTLALLFLLFGSYFAWELYNMMKGGELASSWGWLSGAAIIFAVIKIIEVAGRAGYFPVAPIIISMGYLFVAFFLFMGFFKQRKTLG
ncbi:hypothetical protein KAH81_06305 [bacterium]|nr:hypothetical protein [bacterium]